MAGGDERELWRPTEFDDLPTGALVEAYEFVPRCVEWQAGNGVEVSVSEVEQRLAEELDRRLLEH